MASSTIRNVKKNKKKINVFFFEIFHCSSTEENSEENSDADEEYKKFLDELKEGLIKMKTQIWSNMQTRLSIMLSAFDTTGMKVIYLRNTPYRIRKVSQKYPK